MRQRRLGDAGDGGGFAQQVRGRRRQPALGLGPTQFDQVAVVAQPPRPGGTILALGHQQLAGRKGANQALAAAPAGAQGVIYQTTDVDGRPVATSGAFYDSTAPWNGPGPRPTLILGPGEMKSGGHRRGP